MDKRIRFFCIMLVAPLLALGAVGCLVSAYDLPVSLWMTALWCVVTALVCALAYGKKYPWLPWLLLLGGSLWLMINGTVVRGLEALVYRLSGVYNGGYGWKILRWSDIDPEDLDAALPGFLYLVSSLVTLLAAWAVGCKRRATPALTVTAVLLSLCFVVTDKVPAVVWVFLVFFAGALLLLSASVAEKDQAYRLIVWIAVPVGVALLLLFALVPKNGYNGDARARMILEKWRIQELWERLTSKDPGFGLSANSTQVDLTLVDKQSYMNVELMRLTSPVDGAVYLRSRTLDTYDGKTWTNSDTLELLHWPYPAELTPVGELEISTKYANRMFYLPYYTTSLDMRMYPGGMENTYKMSRYSVSFAKGADGDYLQTLYPDAYEQPYTTTVDTAILTALPKSTERWAKQTVAHIAQEKKSHYHIAMAVADYVRHSAAYSLKTGRMPAKEPDFVRWFLESANTGYCVHFASSAAVLLRAAGIPARYVSGYLVDAKAGEEVLVTDADAHAWVEFWLAGYGWMVLEATPSASDAPAVTPPAENAADEKPIKIPIGVYVILGVLGLLQWPVRVAVSKRRLKKGNPNQRLIARWQYLQRYHKCLKHPPAEEMLALAQKAAFSRDIITEEELEQMDLALWQAKKQLKKRSLFLRIYYAVILAL